MKLMSWLLVPLLIAAQVDDAWAAVVYAPSVRLTDDNDEYIAAPRNEERERSAPGRRPLFARVAPTSGDFSFVRLCVPCERHAPAPLGPPPLYVFMSLQI